VPWLRDDNGECTRIDDGGGRSIGQTRTGGERPDLVMLAGGRWVGNNHHFEFYGDGRVRRSRGGMMAQKKETYGKWEECVAVSNDVGTVTQQGDYLIMVFGGTDSSTCGVKEHQAGTTVRYQIEWVDNSYYKLDELQLVLRDIDCTNGDMWCTDRVERR
jgi:hypothetical protein